MLADLLQSVVLINLKMNPGFFHLNISIRTLLSICSLVSPRCQCSPPTNASDQLMQEWNRTGYSPDSIPWSRLNVSVRPAHGALQCDMQESHPHSHTQDVLSKQTSSSNILLCTYILVITQTHKFIQIKSDTLPQMQQLQLFLPLR